MTFAKRLVFLLLPIALGVVGCSSSKQDTELLDELANLDKETIFERAENLYSDEKYQEARRLFSFVYDSFPNDPMGHKAALRVADTYSVKRDVTSLTEARLRYRDFANRYPNDPDRDYALLMVGQTYSARKLRPDRDLSDIGEALSAYQQLVNLYPNSRYVSEAQTRMEDLRELLAEHEWLVGEFYLRNKRYQGALGRFEFIRENYPDFSKIETVNVKISELETIIAERDAEWKRHIEALEKSSED
jgi:outer membrane protein assembly factor BamD